jgi:glycerol-3-phosphate cytidylyltransferase-like family protein
MEKIKHCFSIFYFGHSLVLISAQNNNEISVILIVFDKNAEKSEKFSNYQTKEKFERGCVCTYSLLLQHT